MRKDEVVKIAVAETSVIIRNGLILLLKRMQGVKILPMEVTSDSSLPDCIRLHKPDILIINPSFPGFSDLRKFKKEMPTENNMKYIALLCSMGDRILIRDFDETFSLYDDLEILKEKLNRLLDVEEEQETELPQEVLSKREKEIVTCIVKGMTNKEIANALFLSTNTVITHRRNIVRKLQIHSPAGLTIYAIINKFVKLQDIKEYL